MSDVIYEPIDRGDGGSSSSDEDDKYQGYTLEEAIEYAVNIGTVGAWDWFKCWYWGTLSDDDPPPEEW